MKPSRSWIIHVYLSCVLLASAVQAGETLGPEVLEKLRGAVAFVRVTLSGRFGQNPNRPDIRQATAFFVSPNVLVTTADVVGWEGEGTPLPKSIEVVFFSGIPGREKTVRAILAGANRELAFLEVPADSPPGTVLEPAPLDGVRETQGVLVPGFPFGAALTQGANPSLTIAEGSVSSLRRDEKGRLEFLQLNADINPGNQGGLVADARCRLLGLAVGKLGGTQVSFCLPHPALKQVLEGRLPSRVRTFNFRHEGGSYAFDAEVLGCDPLRVFKSVVLVSWTRRIVAGRSVGGQRSRCALLRDPATGYLHGSGCVSASSAEDDFCYVLEFTKGTTVTTGEEQHLCRSLDALMRVYGPPKTGGPPPPEAPKAKPDEVVARPSKGDSAPQPVKSTGPVLEAHEEVVDGVRCARLSVRGAQYRLGRELLQLAASPTGAELYAIYGHRADIIVLDPVTFTEIRRLAVPRFPVSLYAEEKQLAVACDEARALVLLDPASGETLRKLTLSGDPLLSPKVVVGRAPDRRWITFWGERFAEERTLALLSEYGPPRKVLNERVNWCCFAQNGARIVVQNQTLGSTPHAPPDIYQASSGQREGAYQYPLLKDAHKDHGFVVETFDRRQIAFPTWRGLSDGGQAPWTYLANQALTRFELEFPGELVAEVPRENLMVSWGWPRKAGQDQPVEVCYVRRDTGQVVRRIQLLGADTSALDPKDKEAAWMPKPDKDLVFCGDGAPFAVYVPGHELFVYRAAPVWNGLSRVPRDWVMVWRCGPIRPAEGGPPRILNELPKVVKVGQTLDFTPRFEEPLAMKRIEFRLHKGPDGMAVDPSTGRVTWNPTAVHVGVYDVVIRAVMDGKTIPFLQWSIEVKD